MDLHHHRFFNILTVSVPLFCFLLSWGASSTDILPVTQPAPPPILPSPSSSAIAAADSLRLRGYALFASTIIASLSSNPNLSGTIFAPPDFAFSFATAKFSANNRRAPPRPSTSLLFFHTLKPPSLTWYNLSSSFSNNFELPTLYNNLCLQLIKTHSGEVAIASSKKPILAVKIRQPDLYVDGNLIVHGIDGVLDPAIANKCSSLYNDYVNVVPPPHIQTQVIDRSLLDHAMRVLRRRGFNVVATALAFKRSELLSLPSITVFAPSDKNLFLSTPDGFVYDFRHHVVPERLRFDSLVKLTAGMKAFKTLADNKIVIVEALNGDVKVNGVLITGTEIYHNRWIVVFEISTSLDNPMGLLNSENTVTSPPPVSMQSLTPGETSMPIDAGILPPAPSNYGRAEVVETPSMGINSIPINNGLLPPAPLNYGRAEVVETPSMGDNSIPINNGILPPAPSNYGRAEVVETPSLGDNSIPINNGLLPPAPSSYVEDSQGGDLPNLGDYLVSNNGGLLPPMPSSYTGDAGGNVPILSPSIEMEGEIMGSPEMTPSLSPAGNDDFDARCASGDTSVGVEGEDLFCPLPAPTERKLQENKVLPAADVEESKPLDSNWHAFEKVSLSGSSISQSELIENDKAQVAISSSKDKDDHANIADDLFFYV